MLSIFGLAGESVRTGVRTSSKETVLYIKAAGQKSKRKTDKAIKHKALRYSNKKSE